ncbi:MAG TPA: AAA family ATPase, partial [Planctomycetota bacterium]|nr:AAA family ATPase [Planctomycetota bacterium]
GHLTDSFGRRVDFRNAVVIMTSNIGASLIKNRSGLGFRQTGGDRSYEEMRKELMEEVNHNFRPEFLGRLDEIIVFRGLTEQDMRRIIELEFERVKQRLNQRGIAIELGDSAKEFLLAIGIEKDAGARPLKRAIETHVEDPLAEELLRGSYPEGAKVLVVKEGPGLKFTYSPIAHPTVSADVKR